MSNDRSVASSDLALAAQLAARLDARAKNGVVPRPSAADLPSGYVRLRPRTVPPPRPPEPDAFGSAAWNELLDWALSVTAAESAILVDRHGLAIGWRGALRRDDVDVTGSQIAAVLDATSRVMSASGDPATAATVDLRDGATMTLVGLGAPFSLAVVGRRDVGRETRDALQAALLGALAT